MQQNNNTNTMHGTPIRLKIQPILEQLQILSQNGDIDASTRKSLASKLSNILRSNDESGLAELHKDLQRLRYGALNPDAIDCLIRLTEKTQ